MSRPVKMFIVLSICLCLLGLAMSARAQATAQVQYYSNLRAGPSTGYAVVGSAAPGDVFAVYSVDGGWIDIGGGRWIAAFLTNYCTDPVQVCEYQGR